LFDAKYVGTWELQALGAVNAPNTMLIRPDGYVAWIGDTATQRPRAAACALALYA